MKQGIIALVIIISSMVTVRASKNGEETYFDGPVTFPIGKGVDSLLPINGPHRPVVRMFPWRTDSSELDFSRDSSPKMLVRLLNHLHSNKVGLNRKWGYTFFSRLSTLSARLKLYPLAMRYYYRALEVRNGVQFSPYVFPLTIDGTSFCPQTTGVDFFSDSSACENLWNGSTKNSAPGLVGREPESAPVSVDDLLRSFSDGKTGISYAMIVHVKQPLPGRRKAFTHFNNVGHTFITLIKYNEDNTLVCRSFGFYPRKDNLFSATPLEIRSSAVFKDDTRHEWDEAVGKFISRKRFDRILGLLKQYDHKIYNLNRNNCTDFGLVVAAEGGIHIADTRGRWPLGHGNNPANAGQSILEGKIRNEDAGYPEPMFLSLGSSNPIR